MAVVVVVDIKTLVEPEFSVQRKGPHKGSGRIPGSFQMLGQREKVFMDDEIVILMHAVIKRGYTQQDVAV